MFRDWVDERLDWANDKMRSYASGDYWFDYNLKDQQFEFWGRKTGRPQMVFPLTVGQEAINDITHWELEHALRYARNERLKNG